MAPSSATTTAHLRRGARWAFCAALVLSPLGWRVVLQARPNRTVYDNYTDFFVTAADFGILATLALWGSALWLDRRSALPRSRVVAAPLAVLTLCAIVTAPFAVDPILSFYHALRLTLFFTLFLYLAAGEVRWRSLAVPAALMVLLQAAVAVTQSLTQRSVGAGWLGELRLDPEWNGISIIAVDGHRWLRAYGLTDHPNLLGGCLAFALLLIASGQAGERDATRTALAGAFIAGALALLVSFSRAAWLAFGAGAVVCVGLLAIARRRALVISWIALAATTLLVLLPFLIRFAPQVSMRLNPPDMRAQIEDEGRAVYERGELNDATLALFASRPLSGVGVGALPTAMSIAYPALTVNYQPAHFVALTVAAETGIAGAAAYALLSLAPWLALARNWRRISPTPALIGASGLLLALSVVSLFDYYPWTLAPGRFWQWSAWGLWSVAYAAARQGRDA